MKFELSLYYKRQTGKTRPVINPRNIWESTEYELHQLVDYINWLENIAEKQIS